MLANGYRVRAVAGAHEAVGVYAEAMLDTLSAVEFQRMRRRRNKWSPWNSGRRTFTPGRAALSEGPRPVVAQPYCEAAIRHADHIEPPKPATASKSRVTTPHRAPLPQPAARTPAGAPPAAA